MGKKIFTFGIAALAIALAIQANSAQTQSRAASERAVVLPAGDYHPTEMALAAAGRTILFISEAPPPAGQKILYALDVNGGKLRAPLRAALGHIYADPSAQLFAVDVHRAEKTELVVLDRNGAVHQKLSQNPPGSFYFALWHPDGTSLVYEADSGDAALDNPFAFTALGILDLDSAQWKVFRVNPTGYSKRFVLYRDRALLCVSLNQDDDPARERYAVYGDDGAALKEPAPDLEDLCRYHDRRYYASHQYEFPSAFEISDAATHRAIRRFPGVDPKTGEQLVAGPWNPVDDDLIIIERQLWKGPQRVSLRAEVYSVSHDGVLVGFTTPVYQWTPDGKSLIVFREEKFIFEPIQP